MKTKKIDYIYAVGRRKESSARVRLYRGKGENTVNGQPANKYFEGAVALKMLTKPFGATETSDKYYFSGRVVGGGKEGQLAAIILGLSRALVKISPEKNRIVLRKASLLTRDARTRERRMVGMGGKARRKKQSPKR
ncbi:MAG TPA: 30S ribosomal protein S9 [Patescibacteria group bacterium]|nr:30S ribosomal protein S9 [Patescibacteria group bacterium]